jgi:hypothetical protein
MARIVDNIEQDMLAASRATLVVSNRADFCVGSFSGKGLLAAMQSLLEEGRLNCAEDDAMLREPRWCDSMGLVETSAT